MNLGEAMERDRPNIGQCAGCKGWTLVTLLSDSHPAAAAGLCYGCQAARHGLLQLDHDYFKTLASLHGDCFGSADELLLIRAISDAKPTLEQLARDAGWVPEAQSWRELAHTTES